MFVASDKDIAARGPILARALKALAEGYAYAARHPAAAEQILIADNRTALANATKIVVATGNATAPHFLDAAGSWGPETDADYSGLEKILASGHVIKSSPPLERALHKRVAADRLRKRCRRHPTRRRRREGDRGAGALLRSAWPPVLALAVVVVAWDLAANAAHASLSFPGPWYVVTNTWRDRANLAPAMWATSKEAVLGIAVAVVCAVLLAVAIDWSRAVRRSLYPLVVISQTIPIIALAPLVVIWFGFGPAPKIVLVALFTFFAVAVGTIQGLGSADWTR